MPKPKAASKTDKRTPLQRAIEDWLAADPARSGNQLNRDAGLATGQISRLRAGKDADLDSLRKLAKALDKPLTALLGEPPPPAADAPGDIEMIPVMRFAAVAEDSLNPRKSFDEESLLGLADDIFAHGLMQPLVVRRAKGGDGVQLIAGERRLRAICKLIAAGRWDAGSSIPCKIVKADDTRAAAMALAENIQREQLNPMEEAEAFDALIKADPELWDTASIAALIHKDIRYVQQRLALVAKLEPTAKEALRGGLITVTQARGLATKPKAVPAGEPHKATAAPPAGRGKTNAVRRADPYPAPSAPRDYPHPNAIQGVKYQFISTTSRGVDGPMPTELVLWDPRSANEARYIRADRVAQTKPVDDEIVPTVADAKNIPAHLRRPDLAVDPDDPLKIPAGFKRAKKG